MPRYRIVLEVEEANIKSVEKKLKSLFGEATVKKAHKLELAKSRADRLSQAASQVEEAGQEVESLKDELQEWFDNLPENFQQGDKGSELEDAISQLEDLKSSIDDLDFTSVSFPSMY